MSEEHPQLNTSEYIVLEGNIFDAWNCEGPVCDGAMASIVGIEINGYPKEINYDKVEKGSLIGPFPTSNDGVIYISEHGHYLYGYINDSKDLSPDNVPYDKITFLVADNGEAYGYDVTMFQPSRAFIAEHGTISPTAQPFQITPLINEFEQHVLNIEDVLDTEQLLFSVTDLEPNPIQTSYSETYDTITTNPITINGNDYTDGY